MKIRTGDIVYVISGKDKGKSGPVLRVLPEKNRVVVEGVNMRVRHVRKTFQAPGQRLKYEAALSLSNVMIIDPKTKKPARIGYKIDEKTGNKLRVAKGSGEIIKAAATAKPAPAKKGSKAPKATKGPKEVAETTSVPSVPSDTSTPPKKQPFWKRAFNADAPAGEQQATRANESAAPAQTVRRSSPDS